MAAYHTFTSTRPSPPDMVALLASLRGLDPSAGVDSLDGVRYVVKKATAWTGPQITAAQNAIDTAPDLTPQRAAQNIIDTWDIATKALVLALIDQLNTIRGKLSPPLGNITAAAALQAVRDKAGTL